VTAAAGSLLLICIFVLVWHQKGREIRFLLCKRTGRNTNKNIEAIISSPGSIGPKRYNYAEIVKMTSAFSNKIGEGGFGIVSKGTLHDGRVVAVKLLKGSKAKGADFVNEVTIIGRTFHNNIASLVGFCYEGSKQALVYEYMPNSSLDKYIYSENPKSILGWDTLYAIAIGIAPDFGLAKLCNNMESNISISGARSTRGFMAPEVHSQLYGNVTTKSDVYSYGMMLLEMVGGRKNFKS
ncbi:hypothetical protein EJB05_36673, partial [Eragrostis curvula]